MRENHRQPTVSRELVIESFRFMVEEGYSRPSDIPSYDVITDPRFLIADDLLFEWIKREEAIARSIGTSRVWLLYILEKSTILIDAGFNDRSYMNRTANEFLAGEQWKAFSLGLFDVAELFQIKISELNRQLNNVE